MNRFFRPSLGIFLGLYVASFMRACLHESLPGVKSCVWEGGCPLLSTGEVDDAPHDDDHQGDDQQEDAGNPTLNQRDQVANQHQAETSQEHQAHH